MIDKSVPTAAQLRGYKRVGELTKLRWADPEYRARTIATMKSVNQSAEHASKVRFANIESWANETTRANRIQSLRASNAPKAPKFSDQEVRDIRDYLDCGYTVGEIAAVFKVSSPIISYIKSGKTYKQVK